MTYSLDKRSKDRMKGVHPDMIRIVERAIEISPVEFIVTEGVRTLARQKQLKAAGASQILKSRHIPTSNRSKMAEAVDLAAKVQGSVRWDWPLYALLGKAMKQAAKELNIPLTWGGDWKTLKDGPHFELTKGKVYG